MRDDSFTFGDEAATDTLVELPSLRYELACSIRRRIAEDGRLAADLFIPSAYDGYGRHRRAEFRTYSWQMWPLPSTRAALAVD